MTKAKIVDIKEQDLGLNTKLKNVKFDQAFDTTTLARAEKVIEQSAESFRLATLKDMQVLKDSFAAISKDAPKSQLDALQDNILNIKSRATIAGFPFASNVAKSLFEFCEKDFKSLDSGRYDVIKIHINSLEQIFAGTFDSKNEQKLLTGLAQLTEKYAK
jgi:hypothetical protein